MAEILIPADDAWVRVVAAGSDASFTYDFPIFNEAHLQVLSAPDADTTPTVKALGTDYAVTGVGVVTGGTITTTASWVPAAGEIVVIQRIVPYDRSTDFTQRGNFKAASINRELDLIVMMIQQLDRRVGRSVHINDIDEDADMELPLKSARVSKYSGWGAGSLPAALGAPTDTSLTTTFSETFLGSSNAGEAITNLGLGTAALEDAAAGSGDLLRTDGDASGLTGRLFDIPFNAGFQADMSGDDVVAAQIYGVVLIDRDIEILGAALAAQTAPTGAAMIVSFEVSSDQGATWTELFSTLPRIADGADQDDGNEVIKTDGTEDLSAGDLVRMVVDQVGSTTAGQELSASLRGKEA